MKILRNYEMSIHFNSLNGHLSYFAHNRISIKKCIITMQNKSTLTRTSQGSRSKVQGFFIRHIINYTGYNQKLNVNQIRSAQWTVQKNKKINK